MLPQGRSEGHRLAILVEVKAKAAHTVSARLATVWLVSGEHAIRVPTGKAIATIQALKYIPAMSTVQEIETAIQKLTPQEIKAVADWLQVYREELWDKQIDADVAAGKLDRFADKALEDYRAGRVKPLDEIIDQP